ncbi:helix-turn-helix domain-containing protein [Streptomyces aureus]
MWRGNGKQCHLPCPSSQGAAFFRAATSCTGWTVLEVSVPQPSSEFGEELRERRLGAGLSLTALSAVVHYSKAQLSKVERGIKAPSRDLARLCDAALHAGGELIGLVATPATGRSKEPARYGIDEEEWVMRLSPGGSSWFQPVGRREVVSAGAASLVSWGTGSQGRVSTTGVSGCWMHPAHCSRTTGDSARALSPDSCCRG